MSELLSLILGTFMFFTMLGFFVLIYIALCLGRMRMFQKAGVAGWKAWLPLYRDYVLCQITMGKGWYFVLGLIPPLYPVMQVLYAIEICLSYKMEILFGVLYFFLPWLAELIIGFGKSEYQGSQDLDQQIRNLFGGTGTAAEPEQKVKTRKPEEREKSENLNKRQIPEKRSPVTGLRNFLRVF